MSSGSSPRLRPAFAGARASLGAALGWLRPGSGEPAHQAAKRSQPARPHGWLRRHWILASVTAVVLVVAGAAGGWLWYLNHQIDNIARIDATGSLTESGRPPPSSSQELNILIAGADNGSGPSIAQDMANGRWQPGSHRSDTIMILHVPADRSQAYLVSIPRDSYVKLYNARGSYTQTDKINAAFSLYGPAGYISTVEHLTGLRMDHLAIIDWQGFKDLSRALHGVRVYIPHTFYDDSQHITWRKGWTTLEGERALQYVRTRHGLSNGDFGRIARQQNFLRAMMSKLLSDGVLHSPTGLTEVLKAITSNLTVDRQWTTSDIRDLALSLRNLSTSDVTFVTAPLGGYDTTATGESIVRLAPQKTAELWKALGHDTLAAYVAGHQATSLAAPHAVR